MFCNGHCTISYTNPQPKSDSSNLNTGISCEAVSGHPALTVAYNTFNLSGCNSSCYSIKDIYKGVTETYATVGLFSNFATNEALGVDAIKYTLYTVA